jgi:hypothetical protein
MGVSDEGHAQPGLDGLVLPTDMACGSAGGVAEEERAAIAREKPGISLSVRSRGRATNLL